MAASSMSLFFRKLVSSPLSSALLRSPTTFPGIRRLSTKAFIDFGSSSSDEDDFVLVKLYRPIKLRAVREGLLASRNGWRQNIVPEEEGMQLNLDMPGVVKDEVQILAVRSNKTVAVDFRGREGFCQRTRVATVGPLPLDHFDLDGVSGHFENGLLNVRIPGLKKVDDKDDGNNKVMSCIPVVQADWADEQDSDSD